MGVQRWLWLGGLLWIAAAIFPGSSAKGEVLSLKLNAPHGARLEDGKRVYKANLGETVEVCMTVQLHHVNNTYYTVGCLIKFIDDQLQIKDNHHNCVGINCSFCSVCPPQHHQDTVTAVLRGYAVGLPIDIFKNLTIQFAEYTDVTISLNGKGGAQELILSEQSPSLDLELHTSGFPMYGTPQVACDHDELVFPSRNYIATLSYSNFSKMRGTSVHCWGEVNSTNGYVLSNKINVKVMAQATKISLGKLKIAGISVGSLAVLVTMMVIAFCTIRKCHRGPKTQPYENIGSESPGPDSFNIDNASPLTSPVNSPVERQQPSPADDPFRDQGAGGQRNCVDTPPAEQPRRQPHSHAVATATVQSNTDTPASTSASDSRSRLKGCSLFPRQTALSPKADPTHLVKPDLPTQMRANFSQRTTDGSSQMMADGLLQTFPPVMKQVDLTGAPNNGCFNAAKLPSLAASLQYNYGPTLRSGAPGPSHTSAVSHQIATPSASLPPTCHHRNRVESAPSEDGLNTMTSVDPVVNGTMGLNQYGHCHPSLPSRIYRPFLEQPGSQLVSQGRPPMSGFQGYDETSVRDLPKDRAWFASFGLEECDEEECQPPPPSWPPDDGEAPECDSGSNYMLSDDSAIFPTVIQASSKDTASSVPTLADGAKDCEAKSLDEAKSRDGNDIKSLGAAKPNNEDDSRSAGDATPRDADEIKSFDAAKPSHWDDIKSQGEARSNNDGDARSLGEVESGSV